MVIGREGKLDSMEKNWASAGAKFVVVYGNHKSGIFGERYSAVIEKKTACDKNKYIKDICNKRG